jgi:hypothetical protein
MGLDREATTALLLARTSGASFDRPLMLGRQRLHMRPADLRAAFSKLELPLSRTQARALHDSRDGFAEPLLELLGAREPASLDHSDFEGSDFVHDLNEPIPADLRGSRSLVWDGGTLEHVFDFPAAVRNAMELVEVGGHLLVMSPANNWMGHGFYQFSPELWFRVLAPENGFRVEWMLIKASRHPASRWYEVRDPKDVGERVTLTARARGTLYVLARRDEDRPLLAQTPQQSDYAEAWATRTVDRDRGAARLKTTVRTQLNQRLSSRMTDALFTASLLALPVYDKRFFKPFDPVEMARAGPGYPELKRSLADLAATDERTP